MAGEVITVRFDGDSRGAVRAANATRTGILRVGDSGRRTTPILSTLAKVAAVGVAAAFAALAGVVKVGFDELAEGQKVMAQTNAVLESTQGVANVTAREVAGLAGELSRMSGVDDELIQKGENLLLTFKNVRNEVGAGNDVFDRATLSALNLSVAGFGSLESTSKMLGKALNDPVKGMTALGRAGVTFSEDQKKAIKAMVETGDLLGAQKLILAEVESQVSGSAKAYGETLPGQLSKARNSFEEVAGSIAQTLLPYLIQLLDWVNEHMPQIQAVIQTTLNAVIATIEFLVPIISGLIQAFRDVWGVVEEVWPAVAKAVGLAVADIDRSLIQNQRQLEEYEEGHGRFWRTVQGQADQVRRWYRGELQPAIENVLTAIEFAWRRFGDTIMKVVRSNFGALVAVVSQPLQDFLATVRIFLALLRGDWGKAFDELKGILVRKLELIKTVLTNAISTVYEIAKAIGKAIVDGIRAGFEGAFESVKNSITSKIDDLKNSIKGGLRIRSPSDVMAVEVGRPMAEGIRVGFIDGSRDLPVTMSDKVREAIEAARVAVEEKRGVFATAFQTLTGEALAAFDQMASEVMTKSEKKLAALDEAERKQRIREGIADARKELADAQAEAAALGPHVMGEAKPEGWDEAAERVKEAQRGLDDALEAQLRARLERDAAEERKALNDRTALRRRHFEEDLAELQRYATRHGLSAEEMNKRLLKIFERYGVPFKAATKTLGLALAEGLREASNEVVNAAEHLRREILDRLSNLRFTATVDVKVAGGNPPGRRQHGGPVDPGMAYWVGEAGRELLVMGSRGGYVIPNHKLHAGSRAAAPSGGSTNVIVNLLGGGYFVGSRDQLADELGRLVAPRLERVAMYGNRI
jgi:hypothetical protein